jgi:hypothetical protein
MSESRDSNDPRDAMRELRKEAREELERAEAEQTGGQEHASRAERAGVPEGGPPSTAKGRGRRQS